MENSSINTSTRLLNLECHDLVVSKCGRNVRVQYRGSEVKDGIFLRGIHGSGATFEEACEDYLNQISGKILVFNASLLTREEIKVL